MLKCISLTGEDFGPFKGVQTIDFTNADGVTFIWGLNGRGKTTLLNIFRFAIYGEFLSRGGGVVDPIELANREACREGRYNFKVVLRMQYGGEDYWLTRQFKLRSGVTRPTKKADYERETSLKKGTIIMSNNDAEHVLRLIMPAEVSRFFLFDGELLQEYADLLKKDSEAGAIIKNSIERILGMPILTYGATDTNAVLETYKDAKNVLARKNTKTEQLGSQIAALKLELQKHTDDLEQKKAELLEQNTKRGELKGKLDQNAFVQKLLGNLGELETSLTEKKSRRETLLAEIVSVTKEAWRGVVSPRVTAILTGIKGIIKTLEDKEIEHQISSRLLDSVRASVAKKHCEICDRDIDEGLVTKLEEQIKDAEAGFGALTPEERAQLNNLRFRRATLEAITLTSNKEMLAALERQLSTLTVEISDAERDCKTIKEQLAKHGDITEMSAAMEQDLEDMAQCLKKIDVLNDGVREITQKVSDLKDTLTSLNAKLDRSDTSAEMVRARRRIELCEQIHNIFEEGIDAYRDRLKTSVEKDATDFFVQITNDPDYVRLEITDNYGLHIIHKDGGEPVPLRSAGFEHVVAISLIGALHKNAPLRGPIIMDSPLFRLDPIHKENVTKLLPQLSDQLVFLAYTHEIDEQFARQTLGAALRKEYKLTKQTSFHTRIEPN